MELSSPARHRHRCAGPSRNGGTRRRFAGGGARLAPGNNRPNYVQTNQPEESLHGLFPFLTEKRLVGAAIEIHRRRCPRRPAAQALSTLLPQKTESARWFAEEVHPHEASLRSYLHGSFPAVRDVDDVVQESYLRVWRVRAAQPIASAKAFLFKVARHLALDLVRRRRVSPIEAVGDLSALPVLAGGAGVAEQVSLQEKIRALADAIEALPARCREVVILRKLQCLSQRETAEQLGLSEKTIEAQLARGLKRCEDFLRRRGVHSYYAE